MFNNRIKNLSQTRLYKNMSWLFFLNVFNTMVPYFVLPYITRQFGPVLYGRYSFAIVIIGYFSTVIEFGFDLTGARTIATCNSKKERDEVFSTIFICRILLFVVCILVLMLLMFISADIQACKTELLILILLLLSNALMTTWFFQGVQKVSYISKATIVVRSIFTIAVFVFIKSADQYYIYVLIYALTTLIVSVYILIIAFTKFNLSLCKVSINKIAHGYKDAAFVFASNCSIKFASTAGVLIIGLLYKFENVGYYSTMEKISTMIIMTYIPIGQAIYPETCMRFNSGFLVGVSFVKKIAMYILPIYSIGCAVLIIFRRFIIIIVFGAEYLAGDRLLLLLLIVPILSIISNLIGNQILLANGNNAEYAKSFGIGTGFSIPFYVLLVYFFQSEGVVLATIAWEIVTITSMIFYIKKISKQCLSIGENQ